MTKLWDLQMGGKKHTHKKKTRIDRSTTNDMELHIQNKKSVPLHAGYDKMFFRLHGPEYYEQKCQWNGCYTAI